MPIAARFAPLSLVLLALAASAVPARAQQSAAPAPSQTREFEHAPSPALGHDLLYSLYLPPGYEASDRRYPTLYLLHGKDGNHLEWLKSGNLQETLDGLIADHRVEPMIVVMPDGDNSWYADSRDVGGPGDYATAIGGDLVAAIDRSLRTKAERRSRAIGGLSMGGIGALHLAFEQPFRYAAVVSFSGALWVQLKPDSTPNARITAIFNGAFGTPFNVRRFLAQSPFSMIDALTASKDPPSVFLTVGDRDRFKLYLDTFEMFRRLRGAGLPVALRVTGGDHEWTTWAAELPEALLFVDQQFKRHE